jgi:hypothetical protein
MALKKLIFGIKSPFKQLKNQKKKNNLSQDKILKYNLLFLGKINRKKDLNGTPK